MAMIFELLHFHSFYLVNHPHSPTILLLRRGAVFDASFCWFCCSLCFQFSSLSSCCLQLVPFLPLLRSITKPVPSMKDSMSFIYSFLALFLLSALLVGRLDHGASLLFDLCGLLSPWPLSPVAFMALWIIAPVAFKPCVLHSSLYYCSCGL
ncbi:dimethylallyl tryptophan synthase GliD1 [Histoplasma ohiense]|nr:dimethylallyl tryptophan synthase GliD1 [Histoplasma ohiense (nom. inval.)]